MKMNKKLITMLAALGLVGCVGVGSTLAYLTDTTKAITNTFTVGKVGIELKETFDEENAVLIPGSAKTTGIEKRVWVEADKDSEDLYTRVFVAIPRLLDDGDPTFDPANNLLHFNFPGKDTVIGEDGKEIEVVNDYYTYWNWSAKTNPTEAYIFKKNGEFNNFTNWNFYKEEINGIIYDVYVMTYTKVLHAGERTEYDAIHNVYLDSKVTSEMIEKFTEGIKGNWNLIVAAQAVQAAGFSDPYTALNATFGDPMHQEKTDNRPAFVSPFSTK